MKAPTLLITAALLFTAFPAAAQLEPGSQATLSGQLPSSLDELPAALGFTVEEKSLQVEKRRKVMLYHVRERFTESHRRLFDINANGRTFGGGYRFIGYAHQYQGDRWWFTLLTPRGERCMVWLEAGDGDRALLGVESSARYDFKSRRAYRTAEDLGPRP